MPKPDLGLRGYTPEFVNNLKFSTIWYIKKRRKMNNEPKNIEMGKSKNRIRPTCFIVIVLLIILILSVGNIDSYKSHDHNILRKGLICIPLISRVESDNGWSCVKELVFIDYYPKFLLSPRILDFRVSSDKKTIAYTTDYVSNAVARSGESLTINKETRTYKAIEHFRMKKDGTVLYSVLDENYDWQQMKNFNKLSLNDPDFIIGGSWDEGDVDE